MMDLRDQPRENQQNDEKKQIKVIELELKGFKRNIRENHFFLKKKELENYRN